MSDEYLSDERINRIADDSGREANELMGIAVTMEAAQDLLLLLLAERNRLRAFAIDIMDCWPNGDVDGGYLQDVAVKHKLLVPEQRTEPCTDDCCCIDYFSQQEMAEGFTCHRRVGWLRKPEGETNAGDE